MIRTYLYKGIPKPQGRPRAARMGKYVRVYEDKKDRLNKDNIAAQIVTQDPEFHADKPVTVTLLCKFSRPKSHFNTKGLTPRAPAFHTQKPDAENLAKAVLDALTGICWKDDSQVVDLHVRKVWTDGEPLTAIVVAGA